MLRSISKISLSGTITLALALGLPFAVPGATPGSAKNQEAKPKRTSPWVIDAHRHIGPGAWRGNFTVEQVLADMEKLGIDRTVVMAMGNVPESMEEEVARSEAMLRVFREYMRTGVVTEELNRYRHETFDESAVIEAIQKYPDKLIGFTFVNPWALDKAEEAVRRHGFRGLKVHPYAKFKADDPVVDGVMKLARNLRLPVAFHTSNPEGTEPWRVGRIAARFPDLKVIMLHPGTPAHLDDAIHTTRAHRNVYADLSDAYPEPLKRMIAEMPPEQILFGSDYPYNDVGRVTVEQLLNLVRNLTAHDARLQKLVLGENMARVLGLK